MGTTMTTTMLGRTLTRSARQLTASPASLLSASSRRAFTSSSSKRQHFHDVDSQALKVLVVDFYAHWCGPCKMISPTLAKAIPQDSDVDLVTVNIDDQMELAANYKVRAVPTIVALRNGSELDRFIGVKDERAVKDFVQKAAARQTT